MNTWFLDTNVLLDVITDRPPFSATAHELLGHARSGPLKLYTSGAALSTAYYVACRSRLTPPEVVHLLRQVRTLVDIAPMAADAVDKALAAGMPDFEDALQYFSALSIPNLTAIITRDPKGFVGSRVEILDPTAAVRRLQ